MNLQTPDLTTPAFTSLILSPVKSRETTLPGFTEDVKTGVVNADDLHYIDVHWEPQIL